MQIDLDDTIDWIREHFYGLESKKQRKKKPKVRVCVCLAVEHFSWGGRRRFGLMTRGSLSHICVFAADEATPQGPCVSVVGAVAALWRDVLIG
jgi:hypothetical protein